MKVVDDEQHASCCPVERVYAVPMKGRSYEDPPCSTHSFDPHADTTPLSPRAPLTHTTLAPEHGLDLIRSPTSSSENVDSSSEGASLLVSTPRPEPLTDRTGFIDLPSGYSLADQPDEIMDLFMRPVAQKIDSLSDLPLLFDTDPKTVADREPPDKPTLPEHVNVLFLKTLEENTLTSDVERELHDLLYDHRHTFAASSTDIGFCPIIQHDIDTGDSRPIKQSPRRPPFCGARRRGSDNR